MKIGIHSWVLETKYSLPLAISRASSIGYDGYEIDIGNFGGTGLGLQILPDRMSEENRMEIKKAKENANIEICSLCLGALWHYPLAGNNETYRLRGVEITRAAITLAQYLGADGILLPIGQPEAVSLEDAWDNTCRSLEACLDLAEKTGITLAVENVCSKFLLSASDLKHLVESISSPFLKIYYDVANNAWFGLDPSNEIRELGRNIYRLHLKNRSSYRGTPGSITNSVGSPGIVEFNSVIQAVKDINYDGYLVVEVPTLDLDADLIAQQNLDAIRNLINT
jgi:sugar phosphate isomerase/epimerase